MSEISNKDFGGDYSEALGGCRNFQVESSGEMETLWGSVEGRGMGTECSLGWRRQSWL